MKKIVGYALSTLVGTTFAIAETEGTSDKKPQEVEQVASTASPATSTQENELEKALEALLEKKPILVVNALQKYTLQQQAAQQEEMNKQLNNNKAALLDKSHASVIGDPQAATKLIIFLDPNCPHCRTFKKTILDIQKTYPNVAFYLRHWPILGTESTETAAGLCAATQQGKFEDLSKKLIESSEKSDAKKITEWAKQAGLDMAKFDAAIKSKEVQDILEKNGKLAEQLGFQGTPTTILASKDGTLKIITPTDKESLISYLKDSGSTESKPETVQVEAPAPSKAS